MIAGRFSPRSVLGGGVLGLAAVSVLGARFVAAAEGIAFPGGLWIVFNVVTTVGFGSGPTSWLGQLVAAGGFLAAATCCFGIVLVAVEPALSRLESDAQMRGALRPLVRRRGPKLLHDN